MKTRTKLALALPFVAIAGLARLITPPPQSATAATPAAAPDAAAVSRLDNSHPVIVRMSGRAGTLTVTSTARGPAYSVTSPSGQSLLAAGTLEDLRRVNPDLYQHVRSGLAANDAAPVLDASIDARAIAE